MIETDRQGFARSTLSILIRGLQITRACDWVVIVFSKIELSSPLWRFREKALCVSGNYFQCEFQDLFLAPQYFGVILGSLLKFSADNFGTVLFR